MEDEISENIKYSAEDYTGDYSDLNIAVNLVEVAVYTAIVSEMYSAFNPTSTPQQLRRCL